MRVKKKNSNKGFTLVELIVVIVILAILIGVTIGGIYKYVGQSRENTDINNASSLTSVLSSLCATEYLYKWANASSTNDITLKWKNAVSIKYYEGSDTYSMSQSVNDDVFPESKEDYIDDSGNWEYGILELMLECCPDGLPESKTGKGFTLTIKKNGGNPVLNVSVGV